MPGSRPSQPSGDETTRYEARFVYQDIDQAVQPYWSVIMGSRDWPTCIGSSTCMHPDEPAALKAAKLQNLRASILTHAQSLQYQADGLDAFLTDLVAIIARTPNLDTAIAHVHRG